MPYGWHNLFMYWNNSASDKLNLALKPVNSPTANAVRHLTRISVPKTDLT